MSLSLPMAYDGTAYTRRLHPISCSLSLSLDPLSTASMVLPPMDEVSALDWVQMFYPDGGTGFYRVASVATDAATGDKDLYLEHGACTLDDILIPETGKLKKDSMKDTVANILTSILGHQSRWSVGTVQATSTIYVELGGMSLMTALLTMMESIPGYMVEFAQNSATDWRVNILQRPTAAVCEGRLSRNLKTCDISYSADSICTRVYGEGLTDGKMDSAKISLYGVHEETISLNEGLSAAQKEQIARAYLDAHDHPAVSISISAVELSTVTGLAFDRFTLGTVCRIAIPWLGVEENEVIVNKSYSDLYNEPEAVSFTLANARPDLAIAVAALTGGGGGGGKGGVLDGHKRFETKFEQTDEHFRLLATDTEWDEMGNGTLTAYGQIVLTTTSFQTVVSQIGADGTITAASIALAINAQGSNAYINADRVKITGDTTIDGVLTVSGGNLVCKGEGAGARGTFEADTIEARYIDMDMNGIIDTTTLSASYANITELSVDDQEATWKSKTVVTGLNITMPRLTRNNTQSYWVYAVNNDTTNLATVRGWIITGYTAGSVDAPTTETIYYLGHT